MVRDRLPDLHKQILANEKPAKKSVFGGEKNNSPTNIDHFAKFEEIRICLDLMSSRVRELRKKQDDILSNPINDTKANGELEELNQQIKKLAHEGKNKLKIIEEQVHNGNQSVSQTDQRIAKSQLQTLSKNFMHTMTEYNQILLDYKDRCKYRIQRKLEIAGQHFNNEQLDKMIESDNPAIFAQNIIADTRAAKQSLADIEARHADVIELESNIRDLATLFNDLALMVEEQGHTLDNIEINVEKAYVDVHAASSDIKKTKNSASSLRKKKMCLAITVVVVILIIILIIVLVVPH